MDNKEVLLTYGGYIVGVMGVLICLEALWSWKKGKGWYSTSEFVANLGIFVGFILSKQVILRNYQLYLFTWANKVSGVHLSHNIITFIGTFLITDFVYYWFHRSSHEIKFLWALHVVHHSGQKFNLSTSYRLNWFSPLVTVLFFIPLGLIGLPPLFIGGSLSLNLLYQFFLHTQVIGKLGPLEGIINTPSAHRVHHGCNPNYLDKNYGGVLMIWDRVFGTYQREEEVPAYGITTGFVSYNPFILITHGFVSMFHK